MVFSIRRPLIWKKKCKKPNHLRAFTLQIPSIYMSQFLIAFTHPHNSMDANFPHFSNLLVPFSSNTFAAGTSNALITSWMDSRIWRNLPVQLLDRVLALLPPPAFFRFRCVCKRWFHLLFNNNFVQLYFQITHRRRLWFLFFNVRSNEGFLLDPYELSWHRLPSAPPPGFSPSASSGGLICWVSENPATKIVTLTNPLSGSLNQLPPTLTPRLRPSIGFTVTSNSIDVTFAGDDLVNCGLAVKNSTTERFYVNGESFFLPLWEITSHLPRLCDFEPAGRMIRFQERLYAMNVHPYGVAIHDVATRIWRQIDPPMRRHIRSPCLVESSRGGKNWLLLVAAVEKKRLVRPKSLRIWGLQDDGASWFEMERMPPDLYELFGAEMERCGDVFLCVGHGEFLVFTIPGGSSRLAFVFDMCSKIWSQIPPCPYDNSGNMSRVFPYEPRLFTPVTVLLN